MVIQVKIKKMHLNKYKRFYDLTIDLGENSKRIIALVGPNVCGKSSVFDAMLYRNCMYNLIGGTGFQDVEYHSLKKTTTYDYQNIQI